MSETVNNYSNNDYSIKDYSKQIIDRIYNLEANIVTLQKAIDNRQFNQSIQSSQINLIKVRNGILLNPNTKDIDNATIGTRRITT